MSQLVNDLARNKKEGIYVTYRDIMAQKVEIMLVVQRSKIFSYLQK